MLSPKTARFLATYLDKLATLRALLAAQKIAAIGEPQFAVDKGPFTPPFMRRNDLLVEIG